MLLIGLDVGTTGCKALLVDSEAGVKARAFREYGIDADGAGKAEQDAEAVWALCREVLGEIAATVSKPDVKAVSLSVQGDAVIPVDAGGNAVHPAILGMDYRCEAELGPCAEAFDSFVLFQRTGMRPHPINAFLKMLWLRRARPAVFDQAVRLAGYADFLMGKLGRTGVLDQCNASRSMAYNLKQLEWDAAVLNAFRFDREKLPEVVPSGTVLGEMSGELVRELGLAGRPLLVAGGHDQPMAAVGAGAITPDIAVASTGTAEVLSRYLSKPVLSHGMYDSYYPCYRSAIGEGYFTFSLNHVGGLALRWFRDGWCAEEMEKARSSGRDPYDVITEAMPEGISPVYVVPHFTGSGTPTCNLRAKAAFVGLTLETDKPTVTLGLLQGLTYELRINLDQMRELGMITTRLRNVGGGARSRRWVQMKADILGLPVDVMENPDAACLGAAIVAGVGAGAFPGIAAGVETLVKVSATLEPDLRLTAAHAENFSRYRELYTSLSQFYRSRP